MNNTLFLECRGCYFLNGDKINFLSDVGNYRVGTYNKSIIDFKGRNLILEFTSYTKKKMRYINKRTNKPLKHPKYETVLENALHIDTEFEDEEGSSWRDCKLEQNICDMNLTYTKENILKVVNQISVKQYNKIVLVSDEKIIDKLDYIYNIGGFRERSIIDNLTEVKTIQYNKEYWVLRFIASDGATFDFEYYSKRITG